MVERLPERINGFVEEVLIAGNRGPCGGVWKVFKQLDIALDEIDGRADLYINWNPVNNIPITQAYEQKGVVNFKNDWSKVPEGSLVIPSAHGVGPDFYKNASAKKCIVVTDGTCQLVTRVHELVKRAEGQGRFIVYIGKQGHPETMGVMGEVDPANIMLIEEEADVAKLELPANRPKIVYSQTTLSTKEIARQYRALKDKFPDIEIPPRKDICYATDTRQAAVDELVGKVQLLIIVGSGPSHNSTELMLIGQKAGIPSFLIDYPDQVESEWFRPDVKRVGISSGASVPDYLMYPVAYRIVELNPAVRVVHEDQVTKEDLEFVFKYDEPAIRGKIREYFAARGSYVPSSTFIG